jgi:putative membrane protein
MDPAGLLLHPHHPHHLAPVVLPLALYTVVRAFRGEFHRHRRIARWTFPVWLYVAVTGVAVYLLMAPYYVH